MQVQNILIRCDSSSTLGIGHLMRSLVLAKRFGEAKVSFATLDLDGNCNTFIQDAGYTNHTLHSNTFGELDALVKKMGIDLVVLDHYELDYAFEKQLKAANKKLTLMVLDDTYHKHFCDILLNHNIYAEAKKYKDLVPEGCELQCGAKYTLLREEFKEPKEISVLVAMGGADVHSLTPQITSVLLKYPNIRVDLITTHANAGLAKLQALYETHERVTLHIQSQDLASLARKSHFCIIAPGVLANELYALRLPFIAIKTAPNQKEMLRFLKKERYKVLKKFDAQKLQSSIEEYLR